MSHFYTTPYILKSFDCDKYEGWRTKSVSEKLDVIKEFVQTTPEYQKPFDVIIKIPIKKFMEPQTFQEIPELFLQVLTAPKIINEILLPIEKEHLIDYLDPNVAEKYGRDFNEEVEVFGDFCDKMPSEYHVQCHYIPKEYREYLKNYWKGVPYKEEIEYAPLINDKRILIIDPYAKGLTQISQFTQCILEFYDTSESIVFTYNDHKEWKP